MTEHSQLNAPDAGQELKQLTEAATGLGQETVDIGGFLEDLDDRCKAQLTQLAGVRRNTTNLATSSETMQHSVHRMAQTADQALEQMQSSMSYVAETGQKSQSLAQWVRAVHQESATVEELLQGVRNSNTMISDIASQVHILAINAKVEAARAGQAGKGFSIVADSVKELSQKTADAAETIQKTVAQLSEWMARLNHGAQQNAKEADDVMERSGRTDHVMAQIQTGISELQSGAHTLSNEADKARQDVDQTQDAGGLISESITRVASGVDEASRRCHVLGDTSEAIMQHAVALGGDGEDSTMIALVQDMAGRVATIFERAISQGHISERDMFSEDYRLIAGTDPQQVMTPFVALTDRALPALQEPVLDLDPRIVFCAAVDRNGFLPTHNKQFSHPQGNDPVENAAKSRNRRIFDDRVGLKSGRNTKPFLLQVYRRDMGGGNFVLMKDLSAPIHIRGRHWGGFRMGYKF
jgi:methyl-accepting chemotaxis protein